MTEDCKVSELVTVRVPMALRKYGNAKRIIAPDGACIAPVQHREPDPTLVKAVARAFRWRKLLESGKFRTITELSKSEKINSSYVSRILRLTLLAPKIIDAILNASLDREITMEVLMKPLPAGWNAQLQFLVIQSCSADLTAKGRSNSILSDATMSAN